MFPLSSDLNAFLLLTLQNEGAYLCIVIQIFWKLINHNDILGNYLCYTIPLLEIKEFSGQFLVLPKYQNF